MWGIHIPNLSKTSGSDNFFFPSLNAIVLKVCFHFYFILPYQLFLPPPTLYIKKSSWIKFRSYFRTQTFLRPHNLRILILKDFFYIENIFYPFNLIEYISLENCFHIWGKVLCSLPIRFTSSVSLFLDKAALS